MTRELEIVRKLKSSEIERRPPRDYDEPGCCNLAGLLAIWAPRNARRGPAREGWCTFVDAGGPGPEGREHYQPIHYCAFCGERLTPDMPVKRRT